MREAFGSGAAAERFDRMVAALGGPKDFLREHERHLRRAPVMDDATAGATGFVVEIDTRMLGLAVVELGGGRRHQSHAIDHSVGLEGLLGLGAAVEPDTPLARIHAATPEALETARRRIAAAYVIGDAPAEETPLILDRIA
jgi:thymidine phosphorylase